MKSKKAPSRFFLFRKIVIVTIDMVQGGVKMLYREQVWFSVANEMREIIISVPEDYDASQQRYPVLYINDGQNAFIDQEAYSQKSWGFLDYVSEHQLDIIMVAIYCGFKPFQRETEYGPWPIDEALSFHETQIPGYIIGGLGDAYVQWLMNELKPMIDSRFRTDPEDTAIVGSSMGGVIASYATLAYPHVFKKCAALSTAFWFYENEFADLIQRQNLEDVLCFYFDIGSDEGCGEEEVNQWYRDANSRILTLLQPKIENLHFRYVGNASHNEWSWSKRLGNFMELFYQEEK